MVGRQGRRRFGAIRRLPSGRYQVRYRTADGRQVTAPLTFQTKADAGRYLSRVEADMLRGEWADPRLGRTTFNEWADRWLDSTVNLRANTKAGYRTILRRYLRPAFGSWPLARIDPLAVRTWLARLEANGVGQATRAKAYRLLARMLGAAVEARYLAINPCGIRGAASDGTSEMRIATVDQVVAIADRVPCRYRALVLVAAFGGLRWGELVGLRRRRVDLEAGTVSVAEQLLEVNGAFSLGPPKSAAGRRTVTLPAAVVDALGEHLRCFTAKQPDAFVFLSSQGCHLRRSNFNRRVWQPAVRAAGVEDLRVHDLRHTAGTLATAAGGSLREVMHRLGHSTTVAAVRYQHVMADRDAVIARELNRLIKGGLRE
jgi:integrase